MVRIVFYFSNNGVPAIGLSPTIDIFNVDTKVQIITAGAMVEIAAGGYEYDFTTYDIDTDYFMRGDGGAMLSDPERYATAGNESFLVDINSKLTEVHGSGSWQPADVSLLALETNVEGHVTNSLNTYDPPTRAEATADKVEIIAEVDANEVKIDIANSDITFLKKLFSNKMTWDSANSRFIIFDDAGTTAWKYMNVKQHDGTTNAVMLGSGAVVRISITDA